MFLLALLSTASASPPGWSLAPLGIGVYVHGKPVRGAAYSLTQAAGITTLSLATVNAYAAAEAEDDAGFARWQGISIAGVSVTALSYLASVLDGSRLHELELEDEGKAARLRVETWDHARAVAARED